MCQMERSTMELIEAISLRKSIRGYLSKPVPKETLSRILELAIKAPSNDNAQPWGFAILGGKALDDLRKAVEEQFLAGTAPHPDIPVPIFIEVYRSRQIELAKSIFQLMNIAREDREKRREWLRKMARFFDAPNVIIITLDDLGKQDSVYYFMFSIGMLTQNIALAAVNFGLGTCVDLAAALYPDVVKGLLGISESKKIAAILTIGYPDWEFPANKVQTTREPLANIATWHGI